MMYGATGHLLTVELLRGWKLLRQGRKWTDTHQCMMKFAEWGKKLDWVLHILQCGHKFPEWVIITLISLSNDSTDHTTPLTTRMAKFVRWLQRHSVTFISPDSSIVWHPSVIQLPRPSVGYLYHHTLNGQNINFYLQLQSPMTHISQLLHPANKHNQVIPKPL